MKSKVFYTVIIGDIVKSRKIEERGKVQEKLKKILETVNRDFKEYIEVRFSITMGDEFQGLLKDLSKSYEIIRYIEKELYPLKIRFGVGMGKLGTPIFENIGEMDGECFVKARKAIEDAKKLGQNIVYNLGNNEKDMIINTILMLLEAVKTSWKDIHLKRIWLYEKMGTYEKVAKKEKISKQMVSKMFKRINYYKVKKAEKILFHFLDSLKEAKWE